MTIDPGSISSLNERESLVPKTRPFAFVTKSFESGETTANIITSRLTGEEDRFDRPYAQHDWVYICVNAKAEESASVPLKIKQRGSKVDLPNNHPLVKLFERPNPYMNGFDLIEAYSIAMDLYGEFFLYQRGARKDAQDIPQELWYLRPEFIKPIYQKDTAIILAWQYSFGEKKIQLPYNDVLHIKSWNPYEPQRGMAPMTPLTRSARIDYKAGEYTEAILDNGGDPGGVLISEETLSPKRVRELREDWAERHEGSSNANLTAILHSGLKYIPIPSAARDMEFPRQREWSRETAMGTFKVPKIAIGLIDDINRNTAAESLKFWWTHTLRPRNDKFARSVTLWRNWGDDKNEIEFYFDYSKVEVLATSDNEKFDKAKKLVDLGIPLNTVIEVCELGIDPVEGGDVVLRPANLVPVQDLVDDPGGFISSGNSLDTPPDKKKKAYSPQQIPGVFNKTVRLPSEKALQRAIKDFYDDALDFALTKAESIFGEKAPRKLTKLQMERILGSKRRWGINAKLTFTEPLSETQKRALRQLRTELGGTFHNVDPQVAKWLIDVARRVGQLTKLAFKDRLKLRDTIIEAVSKSGLDAEKIAKAIKKAFKDIIPDWRAKVIAQTEIGILANTTRLKAMIEEGVKRHKWVTKKDERVRASHAKLHNQIRKIGSKFSNSLLYPLDPNGKPEEVINCRCVTVSVGEV